MSLKVPFFIVKKHRVRFGRSKAEKATEPFKNSVYYLWFEFLKRSERYRICCQNGGEGDLSDMYFDFGDIYNVDFKTWWQTDSRGARLFAEESGSDSMRIIRGKDELNLSEDVLNVCIPLEYSSKYIMTTLRKMLVNAGHTGRKGEKFNKVSTAKYKVVGRVDIYALKKMLTVYDARREHPEMKLYEIARSCRVGSWWQKDDGLDQRNILSNTVSRYLRRSENVIRAVEKGEFPNVRGRQSGISTDVDIALE